MGIVILTGLFFCYIDNDSYAQTTEETLPEKVQTSESIPYRQDQVIPPAAVSRIVVALLIALVVGVIGILFLKKYIFQQHTTGVDGKKIQVLETRRLSPKLVMFLLQVDQHRVLLAQHGDSIVTLELGKNENKSSNESLVDKK